MHLSHHGQYLNLLIRGALQQTCVRNEQGIEDVANVFKRFAR
jgi:hypothetical protein